VTIGRFLFFVVEEAASGAFSSKDPRISLTTSGMGMLK
jgi:hypothetical protein